MRGKLSYGWVVAIASAGIIFAAANFQYSFGVFVKPLTDRFGWSRAAISGSVSARSIMSGLVFTPVGALSDKYGPKRFILLGVLLVGLSYILASGITSLWQLYLFLSILTGIGIACFLTPLETTVIRWFGSRAALPNGILMAGFGMAQIVIPPVATYLLVQHSWEICLIVLGVTAWVLGIIAWFFIKTPADTGEQPLANPKGQDAPKASEAESGGENNYTLSEALHTKSLWILLIIYLLAATSYQMVAIHIIAKAIDTGITPEAAAIILTLSGITNTSGRLVVGGLASRIGNKIVLAPCLAIQAVALYFLAGASELHIFYIIAALFGLAYGGIAPIIPTLAGSFFGTRSLGPIIGILNTAHTAGIAIGPFLAGYVFDATGSYSAAFFSAAIAMAIVFLLSLLLKQPQRKISQLP